MFEKVKRKIKEIKTNLSSGLSGNQFPPHSHSLLSGNAYTSTNQGHTHTIPGHSHTQSTAWPYDPSTGPLEEPFEWFHKVFCPCGSIDWVEVAKVYAWSHIKNANITRKLAICRECEKVTVIDDFEISEQRPPIEADDKFDFFEKLKDLRIDFETNNYPRSTTTYTTSTTSTTSTTFPPRRYR